MDEVTCSKYLMDLQEYVFTREWVGYYFDLFAVKENAILSIEYTLVTHWNIVPENLGIRTTTAHSMQAKHL